MRWQDAFDIKPTKNVRGENTYDVYRKDSEEMLASDIPAKEIDEFLLGLMRFLKRIAEEELESALVGEVEDAPQETTPAVAQYTRLRDYGKSPWFSSEED